MEIIGILLAIVLVFSLREQQQLGNAGGASPAAAAAAGSAYSANGALNAPRTPGPSSSAVGDFGAAAGLGVCLSSGAGAAAAPFCAAAGKFVANEAYKAAPAFQALLGGAGNGPPCPTGTHLDVGKGLTDVATMLRNSQRGTPCVANNPNASQSVIGALNKVLTPFGGGTKAPI